MNKPDADTAPFTLPDRLSRSLLAMILAGYLALAFGYGWVVPLFETPDEHLHYFTADFIAREGRLPTMDDAGLMGQEAAQPPLYYVLASFIVRAVPNATATPDLWPNPKGDPADPRGESLANPPVNVNIFIHGPAEDRPWSGYALAAHLIRMMSAVMGLGTLLCVYASGRVVWPADPGRALLATALVAFLPQFAFIHGAVSNDAAITLFSAAAIWQLLRVTSYELRVTSEESISPFTLLLLGVTIGLAMLSKAAGLLLLVYCAGVLGAAVWSRGGARRRTEAIRAVALVAIPALLLGGWLLWRNWTLYGDPTAANQFVRLAGGPRPYSLYQVWLDMDRVWFSLFALFGWMNVRPPAWIWAIWSAIAVAAAVGALWSWGAGVRRSRGAEEQGGRGDQEQGSIRRTSLHLRSHAPLLILSGWFALVALAWLQFMLRTPADQGRLFFPALIPLALGAAYGLSRWPRPWTQAAVVGLALITSIYSLTVVIPAAYARPPIVDAVPAGAIPLDISFPEGLEVLGARVDTPVARPGEWVWTTIYWRGRPDMTAGAPLAHLELFGRGFHRAGLLTGYHGRGNFPSTLWPVGEIVADRMAVRVSADALAPVEARLTIKLDKDADGIDIGTVKIVPAAWPEAVEPVATLGETIELAAAELSTETAAPGETMELRLRWQVVAPPGLGTLHAFVHLGDPTQPPLAQADGPVMGGEYPSRLWEAGEVFEETVTLALPAGLLPGDYPIHIGLYDFDSGVRLPVIVNGERSPTDVFTLNRLLIVR